MTPIASPSSNFGDGQGGDFPSQNATGEQKRPGVAFVYIHQILNEEHVTYQFRNPGMIPLQEFLMSIPSRDVRGYFPSGTLQSNPPPEAKILQSNPP